MASIIDSGVDKNPFCDLLDIQAPKLYAIFFNHISGWTFNGAALKTKADRRGFIINDRPERFVVKPSRGVDGIGFKIFTLTHPSRNLQLSPSRPYLQTGTDPHP
jgi:hypothetical protein